MANVITSKVVNYAKRWLADEEQQYKEVTEEEFVAAIEQAKFEWASAKLYFDNVVDPDLVDHAIYSIEASERKYMYLLKQAKAKGISQKELF